jgi:5'(3')-deoxyribonucleotidase
MNPTPGGAQAIKKMQDNGNKVYIVTMPWPTSVNCLVEKYYWVQRYIPTIHPSHIIYCKDKELLKGDVIIDDRPNYLESNGCKFTIAMDYKYNRDIPVDLRTNNWEEITDFLESIDI